MSLIGKMYYEVKTLIRVYFVKIFHWKTSVF